MHGNSTAGAPCTLKNWETGRSYTDRLHLKVGTKTGCTRHKCEGSIMTPHHLVTDGRKDHRTKEEKIELAKDFFSQYYEQMSGDVKAEKAKRIKEVVNSIQKTGTYELKLDEVSFGAKTAWRNAPRCIGRFQWQNLDVFDYRHARTTDEMFEGVCKHLKNAYNNGVLKSCMVLFPQRSDHKKDYRVWSGQYLRYAGYQQDDGTVIGDPANVELTEICIKMGWKPKYGRFDVLPVVLQANGEDPEWYELPPELIPEVKLKHPKYKWFEELGLRWFGVPLLSNVLLDVGGVEFPAAPFNGWFISTEVARDLCDVARYNILKEVGEKMGLNTKSHLSLWRDKAFVEVNLAVLHSFKLARMTIADHHSATQAFMKHFDEEMRTRGGCPSDWVWLTPPISGSLTPTFHQEMLNYVLSPSYQYQPNPWTYHVWKRSGFNRKKNTLTFRALARAVAMLSSMMVKAMNRRQKVTILYATETGKSLEFAETLEKILINAFNPKVICMKDYDVKRLKDEKLLLVITSTFGNGDPPDNGVQFYKDLHALVHDLSTPMIKNMAGVYRKLRFSVFGLGSRAYPNYCAFAHDLDSLFGQLQGKRILKMKEGDELHGQDESFNEWAKNIFETACDTFGMTEDAQQASAITSILKADRKLNPEDFRLISNANGVRVPDVIDVLSTLHHHKISVCSLGSRSSLQSRQSSRSTVLVELESSDPAMTSYRPGDHVAVFPTNRSELVAAILGRIKKGMDINVPVKLQEQSETGLDGKGIWTASKHLPVCSVKEAFLRYLDITTPPTQQLLRLLSECASQKRDKNKLLCLSESSEEYEKWRFSLFPTIPEVLEEFPSVEVDASLLMSQLPLLKSRLYSISSSVDAHPGQVHCTVAVVSYQTRGGKGPVHHGVCSSYLAELSIGSKMYCYIRQANEFHMPKSRMAPMLLIGPGTGIAPFRSFWQQRNYDLKRGKTCGPLVLLFGCRHPDEDHLYSKEIASVQKAGAISLYETAFSRRPGKPKKYVQNLLEEKLRKLTYKILVKKTGHIYICGSATMANDVELTLCKILTKEGNLALKDAKEYIRDLKENNRLHLDVFGNTLIAPPASS